MLASILFQSLFFFTINLQSAETIYQEADGGVSFLVIDNVSAEESFLKRSKNKGKNKNKKKKKDKKKGKNKNKKTVGERKEERDDRQALKECLQARDQAIIARQAAGDRVLECRRAAPRDSIEAANAWIRQCQAVYEAELAGIPEVVCER